MKLVERIFENEKHRYQIFQISFLILFAISIPLLQVDIATVMQEKKQLIYIGIFGLIAMVTDTIGTIIKSKELSHQYSIGHEKSFNRFFVFFWMFRVGIFGAGAIVTGTALIGDNNGDDGAFSMGLMIEEIMRWVVMGCVVYYFVTSTNKRKLTIKKKFIGDLCLMYSSVFYLSCMWSSMGHTNQNFGTMNTAEYGEYYGAGLLLFLIIYVPSTFFHFLNNILSARTTKDRIRFWLGIIFTGILALTYVML